MLPVYQRVLQVRLRRTPGTRAAGGGGAAFFPATATTVALDAEGFAALTLLDTPQTADDLRRRLIAAFGRNFTRAEVDILCRHLAELRFVTATGTFPPSVSPAIRSPEPAADIPPPPESIHLQL